MGQTSQRKVLLFKELEDNTRGKGEERRRAVVKVPSLLFDIELEDGVAEETKLDDDLQDVLQQLKSLVQPWTPDEQCLRQQVQKACAEAAQDNQKLDAHQLAKRLELPGYTFKVRTALGGGWGGDCLRQLRHFFLTCIVSGSMGPVSYIIDPCFKEQFEIANPTPQYSRILSELPSEFVGAEERIGALVVLLSNEIKRSFQATGNTLPPWRAPASMLSKWKPRRSEDIAVSPASARPASALSPPTQRAAANSKEPISMRRQVDISVTSSIDDVARTIAETGGSKKLGVPSACPSTASPRIDVPNVGVAKRGREQAVGGSKCASLLAAKLRGVSSFGVNSSFPSLYSNKGQA